MKYQQPTFSAPVSNGKVTKFKYQIAVGLRCPTCLTLFEGCICSQLCNCDEPRTADGDNCLTCGKAL